MKKLINLSIAVGIISLITGIISRIVIQPFFPFRLQAHAFLGFTNTCFLFAITLALLQILKAKKE